MKLLKRKEKKRLRGRVKRPIIYKFLKRRKKKQDCP